MITSLKENQIFVFGSNLAGIHAGGAAKYAKDNFGAEEGVGEGMTGQCYAFPSLTGEFKQRGYHDLRESVKKFFNYAIEHPDKEFLMSTVGTGIAGFSVDYMKGLFANLPENVILPPEWKPIYRCLCGEEFKNPKILHIGEDEFEQVCPECSGTDYKEIDYNEESN